MSERMTATREALDALYPYDKYLHRAALAEVERWEQERARLQDAAEWQQGRAKAERTAREAAERERDEWKEAFNVAQQNALDRLAENQRLREALEGGNFTAEAIT